jgi:hypothetical protein
MNYPIEEEMKVVYQIILEKPGIHQTNLLTKAAQKMCCTTNKAGYRLKALVGNGSVELRGFRVYPKDWPKEIKNE